jgi:alpha-L-rhamnosidase
MYRVATQTTYPGWGFMASQGATTIWESWSLVAGCGNAESMIMWATIDEFFYNDLAGIKGPEYYGPDYAPGGFRMIEIEPHALGDLQFARASIRTVRGMISSNWRKTDRGIRLEVVIPVGSRAKVSLPKMSLGDVTVAEGGQVVWKQGDYAGGAEGISAGCETDRHVTFEVGGGKYCFELAGTPRAGKRT